MKPLTNKENKPTMFTCDCKSLLTLESSDHMHHNNVHVLTAVSVDIYKLHVPLHFN